VTPPAGAAAARPHAQTGSRPRPSTQRRLSGPGRPAAARAAGVVASPPLRTVRYPGRAAPPAPSLAEAVGRLCDSRLLDRLMRGRLWIGFVAFALIGIVAMQLALLKMNTGIGRDLQRETVLARQNADLEAEVSGLASVDRVQTQAAALGMLSTTPGSARFLSVGDPQARQAAAVLDATLGSAGLTSGAGAAASPLSPGSAASAGTTGALAGSTSTATGVPGPPTGTSAASGPNPVGASSPGGGAPAVSAPAPAPPSSPSAAPTVSSVTPTQSSAPAGPSASGGGASVPVGG
jgi:hypothetical protein